MYEHEEGVVCDGYCVNTLTDNLSEGKIEIQIIIMNTILILLPLNCSLSQDKKSFDNSSSNAFRKRLKR